MKNAKQYAYDPIGLVACFGNRAPAETVRGLSYAAPSFGIAHCHHAIQAG
jgi:hypothetical protein